MSKYYVYIMTNYTNSVLYIGVTNDVQRRVNEHKYKTNNGYAEKLNIYKLVYIEETVSIEAAIRREKQLKSLGKRRIL